MKKYTIFTLIIIILLWSLLTVDALNLVNPVLIPSPYKVYETFVNLFKEGYGGISFFTHISTSLGRLLLSVLIAIVIGIPLGLLSGSIKWIDHAISGIIEFIRPLPPLSYYMLLILWIGIGNESKIVLLAVAAFAPIYIQTVSAVKQIPKEYIMQAQALGASRIQIFKTVILYAAASNIITGIRTATGVAYTTLVSAEMVAAVSGIGWMILDASNYLKSSVIFAGIITIGISALCIDYLIRYFEHKVIFWKGQRI